MLEEESTEADRRKIRKPRYWAIEITAIQVQIEAFGMRPDWESKKGVAVTAEVTLLQFCSRAAGAWVTAVVLHLLPDAPLQEE